jgi:hypothetical protein
MPSSSAMQIILPQHAPSQARRPTGTNRLTAAAQPVETCRTLTVAKRHLTHAKRMLRPPPDWPRVRARRPGAAAVILPSLTSARAKRVPLLSAATLLCAVRLFHAAAGTERRLAGVNGSRG